MATNFQLKRRQFGLGALATGAAVAAPAIVRAQQTITWRLQSVDQPTFVGPAIVLPLFAERIEKMSAGRLKINIFSAGQLIPSSEIPAALNAGAVDIAYTSPTYSTGSIPEGVLATSSLPPLVLRSRVIGEEIYWGNGIDDIQREAFKRNGIHYIESTFAGDYITFWSREKISSLEELRGKKIRTYGYFAKTMDKLGAAATFIPHEEVYTSLAQGVIDGAMTASTFYARSKYHEVAPYFHTSPWSTCHGMAVMASSRSWKALPDDLKEIVTAATRLISADILHYSELENVQMINQFEKLGVTAVSWSDSDMNKIRSTAMDFLPEIAATNENVAKGIKIITDYVGTT